MTCRQVIAARPALEADKQRLPWVQHDEQPLSAGEPSVLGLRLELARQSADLLLFSSSDGYRRLINWGDDLNPGDREEQVFGSYYQVIHRLS
jgi:hypothetical protein